MGFAECTDHRTALASVIAETIAPAAAQVDRTGAYPRPALEALGAAGILGLMSAAEVGGGDGSLADAAEVVETIAAACGSTLTLTNHATTPSRPPAAHDTLAPTSRTNTPLRSLATRTRPRPPARATP